MHEALISRGDVRGRRDVMVRIMVKENCALLHHRCHMHGSTSSLRGQVLYYLLETEGQEAIIQWLESMRLDFKTGLIDERIREVKEMCHGEEEV